MFCQACGAKAPSTYVAFYWNIGAFFLRWYKHIAGNLCKQCIHKHFWEYTLINVTLGWWGLISLVVTPFFIVNNVVRYIVALVRLRKAPHAPASQPNPAAPQAAAPFSLHVGAQSVPLDTGRRIELSGRGLAEVSRHPNDASILGLKNISGSTWIATPPDGTPKQIEIGRSIRLTAGTRLDFGNATGEIR